MSFSFFDDAVSAVSDWWSGTPSSDSTFGFDMSSGDTSWVAASDSQASWLDSVPAPNWESVAGAATSVAKDVGSALVKSVPTAVGSALGGTGSAATGTTNVNVTSSAAPGAIPPPPDPTPKPYKRRSQTNSFAQQQLQQNSMFPRTQAIRDFS
jgi:hypothetical protein